MSHQDYSFKVATTLSAYRAVYISAANTVALANSAGALVVGITTDTVKDTTSGIPVRVAGVGYLEFNQTISAGAEVGIDTVGRGVVLSDTITSRSIGYALEAVDATATIAKIVIHPGKGG